jgi:SPP1 gp7 family putative phage head morphogenesis protein
MLTPVHDREASPWAAAHRISGDYGRQLHAVVREINSLLRGYDLAGDRAAPELERRLRHYAESQSFTAWSHRVAESMLRRADIANRAAWAAHAEEMSAGLRRLMSEPIGSEVRHALLDEQVRLIKGIPLGAAERIRNITVESLVSGRRSSATAREILRTADVSASRARLIARTESGRLASKLTEARCVQIGSEDYVWHATHDFPRVRASHLAMDLVIVRWTRPPTLDGLAGHAGCLPNCRCYAEPRFPKH